MRASDIALTLIGGPTALIEFAGVRLLTDPTFDPPGLYQETPVRFEKTSGPALSVEEIEVLDGVLLSHDQHFDNLDHAGRAMLPRVPVVYTTAAGARRLGGNARALAPFETHTLVARNGKRGGADTQGIHHGSLRRRDRRGGIAGQDRHFED